MFRSCRQHQKSSRIGLSPALRLKNEQLVSNQMTALCFSCHVLMCFFFDGKQKIQAFLLTLHPQIVDIGLIKTELTALTPSDFSDTLSLLLIYVVLITVRLFALHNIASQILALFPYLSRHYCVSVSVFFFLSLCTSVRVFVCLCLFLCLYVCLSLSLSLSQCILLEGFAT